MESPLASTTEAQRPDACQTQHHPANLIYFEKAQLPQPLVNQLIRLAAFQNPEFYKAQALRLSV